MVVKVDGGKWKEREDLGRKQRTEESLKMKVERKENKQENEGMGEAKTNEGGRRKRPALPFSQSSVLGVLVLPPWLSSEGRWRRALVTRKI